MVSMKICKPRVQDPSRIDLLTNQFDIPRGPESELSGMPHYATWSLTTAGLHSVIDPSGHDVDIRPAISL
jgi:hypothetical protein